MHYMNLHTLKSVINCTILRAVTKLTYKLKEVFTLTIPEPNTSCFWQKKYGHCLDLKFPYCIIEPDNTFILTSRLNVPSSLT